MFEGSTVALVTPFRDGKVDEKAMGDLVEFHLAKGTDALLPCGCTGEAATLDHEEQIRTIQVVIEAAAGKVPVLAGTGSNSTREAIHLTGKARKLGADAALLISPYYNKPTQEGIYLHYKAVAEAVDIPVVLYNVPSRTGKSIEPETVARLSEIANIVAIKEASGSVDQSSAIAGLCDIIILSGDDSLTLPLMSVGARGVVSVAANVVPDRVAAMTRAWLDGDPEQARKIHYELLGLFKALFIETNPIPVKTTLAEMGMIAGEFRLPLCPMSEANRGKLLSVIRKYKLTS
ncbi:MAG: 4-hydroxy-tetrahydrodipicolinate synthase [Candidatus Glassbacteria bacterium]|nr:4-hydroxy-tetrahydrodipicolinate synthase [Candidatus Glassbacteria bacterium]